MNNLTIEDMQKEFALKQMEMEHSPKRVVIVRKRHPVPVPQRRTRRFVIKTVIKTEDQLKAEDAQLALMLDAYDSASKAHKARSDVFNLNYKMSLGDITGIHTTSEEEKFVKFMVREEKEKAEWIKAQNFPEECEMTQEDYENESREKLAIKIYRQHLLEK